MPGTPSSPLAELEIEVERRRQEALNGVSQIPIAALIWGPAPSGSSPVADARVRLREALAKEGHLARFSEELINRRSPYSILTQQAAQVSAYDIVFSLPDSWGSVAEIHDFARLPVISQKIVTFIDHAFCDGYASKSLIELESIATCRIQLYNASDLPNCIIDKALDFTRRLQELRYLIGRRY